MEIHIENLPNPHSKKFAFSRTFEEECSDQILFEDPQKARRSPLAHKIFGFPWASSVLIAPNYVIITKQDWVDWDILEDPLLFLIKEHFNDGESPFLLGADQTPAINNDIQEDDSEVVQKIKEILNRDIRPIAAMDGGDIRFHKYEDNVLFLTMQGACAGCPSATMTLKQGVEKRMRQALPEIKEVIAIQQG